jgi:hypothetical protein
MHIGVGDEKCLSFPPVAASFRLVAIAQMLKQHSKYLENIPL